MYSCSSLRSCWTDYITLLSSDINLTAHVIVQMRKERETKERKIKQRPPLKVTVMAKLSFTAEWKNKRSLLMVSKMTCVGEK